MNGFPSAASEHARGLSDSQLPGLDRLLDTKFVASIVSTEMPEVYPNATDCRIAYIRYKPGTSCVIAYLLCADGREKKDSATHILYGKCYDRDDFALAAEKANASAAMNIGSPHAIVLSGAQAVLFPYMADPKLDSIETILDHRKMRRILYRWVDCWSPDRYRISHKAMEIVPVRYKPEKRAVFRLTSRITDRSNNQCKASSVYIRHYRDDRGRALFELMDSLHRAVPQGDSLCVPRPYAYITDKRILLIEGLQDRPMTEALDGDRRSMALSRAATALAHLHSLDIARLPERSSGVILKDANATASMLRAVLPASNAKVSRVVGSFQSLEEADLVADKGFVHGDYFHGQILMQDRSTAIIDFDRSYRGETLADLGNFCAHLIYRVVLSEAGSRTIDRDVEQFVLAYEKECGLPVSRERLAHWITFSLHMLAIAPFRALLPDWKSKVDRVIRACEESIP